jgi:hypothetical protein
MTASMVGSGGSSGAAVSPGAVGATPPAAADKSPALLNILSGDGTVPTPPKPVKGAKAAAPATTAPAPAPGAAAKPAQAATPAASATPTPTLAAPVAAPVAAPATTAPAALAAPAAPATTAATPAPTTAATETHAAEASTAKEKPAAKQPKKKSKPKKKAAKKKAVEAEKSVMAPANATLPNGPFPALVLTFADSAATLSAEDNAKLAKLVKGIDPLRTNFMIHAYGRTDSAYPSDAKREGLTRALRIRQELIALGLSGQQIGLQPMMSAATDKNPHRVEIFSQPR